MDAKPDGIIELLQGLDKSSFSDEPSRTQVAEAAHSLFLRLESPYARFVRHGYAEPALDTALIVCRNLDLFNQWPEDRSQPMAVAELAKSSGASEDVLRRILKHLASTEDLVEVDEDVYLLTDFTASLKMPTRTGIIGHGVHKAVRAIPDWLTKNNYKSPSDPKDCPLQLGIHPEHTFWSWLKADADMGERFNLQMQGMASEWRNAIGLYPVQEKLVDGFHGGVLMLDLGGGVGHDLESFIEKWPVEGAEYILQDVENVLDAANPKPPVKKMPHDFFTEQPVKGARSIFLKQIMHDWPDEQAIDILKNLRPAMAPGYTKLLIHDIVVPSTRAPPYTTAIDLFMMALFGARERTRANFEALIKAADLKLEKVWSGPGYRESLIEVVREK